MVISWGTLFSVKAESEHNDTPFVVWGILNLLNQEIVCV